jgi:hypothetical protein
MADFQVLANVPAAITATGFHDFMFTFLHSYKLFQDESIFSFDFSLNWLLTLPSEAAWGG